MGICRMLYKWFRRVAGISFACGLAEMERVGEDEEFRWLHMVSILSCRWFPSLVSVD